MSRNKDTAQKGLILLKEAVLNEVRDNPPSITITQVARNLGIESSNLLGEQKNRLSHSILWLLEKERKIKQIAPRKGWVCL